MHERTTEQKMVTGILALIAVACAVCAGVRHLRSRQGPAATVAEQPSKATEEPAKLVKKNPVAPAKKTDAKPLVASKEAGLKPNATDAKPVTTGNSKAGAEEAERIFKEAIKYAEESKYKDGYFARYAEVTANLSRCVKLAPDNAKYWDALARALATYPIEGMRNNFASKMAASKACSLTKLDNPIYIGTFAEVYAADGDFKSAIETLRTAIYLTRECKSVEKDQLQKFLWDAKCLLPLFELRSREKINWSIFYCLPAGIVHHQLNAGRICHSRASKEIPSPYGGAGRALEAALGCH